jgi:hypothetical protein
MTVGVRRRYNSSSTNLKKLKDKGVGSEERGSMESVLHAQSIYQETMLEIGTDLCMEVL